MSLNPTTVSEDFAQLADLIRSLARKSQGDALKLLALLRMLEQVHAEIREGLFQSSLPKTRQDFYALLRNIEEEGGWPYIERMRLRSLLEELTNLDRNDNYGQD